MILGRALSALLARNLCRALGSFGALGMFAFFGAKLQRLGAFEFLRFRSVGLSPRGCALSFWPSALKLAGRHARMSCGSPEMVVDVQDAPAIVFVRVRAPLPQRRSLVRFQIEKVFAEGLMAFSVSLVLVAGNILCGLQGALHQVTTTSEQRRCIAV